MALITLDGYAAYRIYLKNLKSYTGRDCVELSNIVADEVVDYFCKRENKSAIIYGFGGLLNLLLAYFLHKVDDTSSVNPALITSSLIGTFAFLSLCKYHLIAKSRDSISRQIRPYASRDIRKRLFSSIEENSLFLISLLA